MATAVANAEFFTKVAEAATRFLSESTADGFLFRVDARLRPEGAWGPLVHSLSAIENYYPTAGQTWERLALFKARPVAATLPSARNSSRACTPFAIPAIRRSRCSPRSPP